MCLCCLPHKERLSIYEMSPNVGLTFDNLKERSLWLCHFWSVCSNKGGLTYARWVLFNSNRLMLGIIGVDQPQTTPFQKYLTEFWSLYIYSNRPKCLPGKCLNSLTTGNVPKNKFFSFVQSIHLKYSIFLPVLNSNIYFCLEGKFWHHKCQLFHTLLDVSKPLLS